MAIGYTIAYMQQLAVDRGGKCLSKEYWGAYNKLVWMCSKGHTWDTIPALITRGSWCPTCANRRRKYTIDEIHELASKRGFKCLSNEYISVLTKLKWKCGKGHVWNASSSSLIQGNGCSECSGKAKGTIEKMKLRAEKKGGKCLSTKYVNSTTKLKWQCHKGHRWMAAPSSIISAWCPHCYGNVKHTLREMKQIAKKRGGKCFSKIYVNKDTKLKWQCAGGHVWKATPGSIINQESWCLVCARKKTGNRSGHTIEEMYHIAKTRKGRCLSKKYRGVDTPLKWQCTRGHVWNAIPYTILHRESWCAQCRYIDKRTGSKESREKKEIIIPRQLLRK